MAFQLDKLPYDYDALEPHIDAQTMKLHHDKHHRTYCDQLNEAIQGTPFEKMTIEAILRRPADELPEDIRNHGGGFANHNLFWQIMSPRTGVAPSGDLVEGIKKKFSTFHQFRNEFSTMAKTHFGSGWVWLVVDGEHLEVMATPNQDSPLMANKTPILGLDVWEHAYYLKYQNKRPDYISAWWNIVNWPKVQANYAAARAVPNPAKLKTPSARSLSL